MKKNRGFLQRPSNKKPKRKKRKRSTLPPTPAMESSRRRFGLTRQTLALFKEVWRIVNQYRPKKYRDINILFKRIYENAVVPGYLQHSIDYAAIELMYHGVDGIDDLKMVMLDDGQCNLVWERNAFALETYPAGSAELIVFVINETKHVSHLFTHLHYPEDQKLSVTVPGYNVGHKLHCWVTLIWPDAKLISDSEYTQGEI